MQVESISMEMISLALNFICERGLFSEKSAQMFDPTNMKVGKHSTTQQEQQQNA